MLADVPGALAVPEILVLNKADIAEHDVLLRLRGRREPTIEVSALTGEGMDELLMKVSESLPRPAVRVDLLLPYTRGDLVARRTPRARSSTRSHGGDGYELTALVSEALAARMHEAADKHAAARD